MSSYLRRTIVGSAALVIGLSGLAACGSDSDSGGGDGGSSNDAKITAACSLDNPPKSEAEAPAEGTAGKASGKVGAILPDTTSSTRYTLYDAPLLTKALKAGGLTPDVQNAQGDKNKFASIAANMIGDGSKVLIIDSIDAASGAGVEAQADKAGVKVIDYDRPNLGGSAPYYVSFDNEEVGRLQAQTMVDCLNAQKIEKPKIIMMNGGTDVDNNAVLFQKGAHSVLDPLADEGKLTIEQEATVKGWLVEMPPRPSTRRSPRPTVRSRESSRPTTPSPTQSSACSRTRDSTATSSSPVRTPASPGSRTSSPASRA